MRARDWIYTDDRAWKNPKGERGIYAGERNGPAAAEWREGGRGSAPEPGISGLGAKAACRERHRASGARGPRFSAGAKGH